MGIPKAGCGEVCPMHTKRCPPPPQEPMEGCPPKDPVKKHIRFNYDDDFSDDPSLTTDLATIMGALLKSGKTLQALLFS